MQFRSVCPYDCPDACGLIVNVENNRAEAVSGDPEHPVTKGFICGKMRKYAETVHSAKRLVTPLERVGAKGDNRFREIGWDDAVQKICSKFRQVSEEYGAEAILPYSYAGTMGLLQRNSGHPFFHKLGASRLERTICTPAKDAGWKLVMGETPAVVLSDIEHSDLIILWGLNAAATSIHSMMAAQKARRGGATVWAVDTYQTLTCNAVDEAVIVKPGGDGALVFAIMQIIISEKLYNQEFIDKNVQGFSELQEQVKSFDISELISLCGVPEETIYRLAKSYASARASFIQLGGGLTRYGNGAMNVRCITCLPALTGAWDKKGGGLFCSTSTGAAFSTELVTREDFMQSPSRIINMNRLGTALDVNCLNDPPVMALYVYHSNPAIVAPDHNAVIKGLQRNDLFTVVHERFMTDTARYADIVLPATSSFEHPDLYRCYGSYHAQRCNAVIPPVAEAKSNWDTFCLLAEGMGWNEPFFRQSADELIEQLISPEKGWMTAETARQLCNGIPIMLTPPLPDGKRWLTASGKIELLNPTDPEPLPRLTKTCSADDTFPLMFQSAVSPHCLNSSFNERDDLVQKRGKPSLMMNHADAVSRKIHDGQIVKVFNNYGEIKLVLQVTDAVPSGTVVSEGLYNLEDTICGRGVNALTSQRLTDRGAGSTLYDVAVDVCCAE